MKTNKELLLRKMYDESLSKEDFLILCKSFKINLSKVELNCLDKFYNGMTSTCYGLSSNCKNKKFIEKIKNISEIFIKEFKNICLENKIEENLDYLENKGMWLDNVEKEWYRKSFFERRISDIDTMRFCINNKTVDPNIIEKWNKLELSNSNYIL